MGRLGRRPASSAARSSPLLCPIPTAARARGRKPVKGQGRRWQGSLLHELAVVVDVGKDSGGGGGCSRSCMAAPSDRIQHLHSRIWCSPTLWGAPLVSLRPTMGRWRGGHGPWGCCHCAARRRLGQPTRRGWCPSRGSSCCFARRRSWPTYACPTTGACARSLVAPTRWRPAAGACGGQPLWLSFSLTPPFGVVGGILVPGSARLLLLQWWRGSAKLLVMSWWRDRRWHGLHGLLLSATSWWCCYLRLCWRASATSFFSPGCFPLGSCGCGNRQKPYDCDAFGCLDPS